MSIFSKQKEQVVPAHLLYSESLALGLFLYAQKNPSFREILEQHVHPSALKISVETVPASVPLLYPESETVALKRATWIQKYGTKQSRAILAEAIKDKPYESPKAVVLGITIGILPIGIMGHDKPGGKVTVISLNTLKERKSLTQGGTRTSLSLLERSIKEAGGELKKVDPDMSDWFFGEKTIEFFSAERKTIKSLIKELETLDVPHTHISDEHGATTLAISPAINPETLSLDWDIEKIK